MKLKKYIAVFLIIIIMALIGLFEFRHLKNTFSKMSEENFLTDIKKAVNETKDIFPDISILQSTDQEITTSTEERVTNNTSTEVLSKEQLKNLKKKILEHNEKKK